MQCYVMYIIYTLLANDGVSVTACTVVAAKVVLLFSFFLPI